jgi:hypothetical protein
LQHPKPFVSRPPADDAKPLYAMVVNPGKSFYVSSAMRRPSSSLMAKQTNVAVKRREEDEVPLTWKSINSEYVDQDGKVIRGGMSVKRAKVPGGWLVIVHGGYQETTWGGPVFIPDPEYVWDRE